MNDVIWFCKNKSHQEFEALIWVFDDQSEDGICPDPECNKKMIKYHPQSSLTALQAKLDKAKEALKKIEAGFIDSHYYGDDDESFKLMWIDICKFARETLKELGAK